MMASIVFEVECEVEGRVAPGEHGVGIMGPYAEDADLSSVSMLKGARRNGRFVWDGIDLLEGLDAKARNIVIANIMAAFATDIDEAILSDA